MSYIITYVDDHVKQYLRAETDDGIHGKHGVMFSTGRNIKGVPSKYDMKNAGIQLEVSNITWEPSGRSGFYRVDPADIIRVIPNTSSGTTSSTTSATPLSTATTSQVSGSNPASTSAKFQTQDAENLIVGQIVKIDNTTDTKYSNRDFGDYGIVLNTKFGNSFCVKSISDPNTYFKYRWLKCIPITEDGKIKITSYPKTFVGGQLSYSAGISKTTEEKVVNGLLKVNSNLNYTILIHDFIPDTATANSANTPGTAAATQDTSQGSTSTAATRSANSLKVGQVVILGPAATKSQPTANGHGSLVNYGLVLEAPDGQHKIVSPDAKSIVSQVDEAECTLLTGDWLVDLYEFALDVGSQPQATDIMQKTRGFILKGILRYPNPIVAQNELMCIDFISKI